MDEKQIKEKIKLAEASVSDLQDQTLKEKAFEVVLSSLLHQTQEGKEDLYSRHDQKKRASPKKVHNLSLSKEPRKSSLKFTEDQLKELKAFYDKFKPSGRELSIFVLANFLRLVVKQDKFHEGDIEHCFQQLLNLRTTTRPPRMIDLTANIRQTLSWLVTPSRNKQWLQVDKEMMYGVSPVGILKFNDLEDKIEAGKREEKTE